MRPIKKNSTDQSVVIRIIDATDGTPEQAVEHDTVGIDLWYRREGATRTAIVEAALAALDTAHADGGIEHIDDGYYRLDLPDAAVATGVNGVMIGGAVTGMIVIGCYVHLTDYDPQDAVRMGMTALPNAAADAAGGLPISDDGGFDIDGIVDHANYGLNKLVRSTTPANTLDVSAAGEVTVPDTQRVLLANSNDHGGATAGITLNGAAGLTSSTGVLADITGNLSGSIGTVSANGITNASFHTDVGTTAYASNAIGIAAMKAIAETHIDHLVIRANTAAGGAVGSITLDAAASATDNFYDGQVIVLTAGTGAGQSRRVDTYTGATKVATVTPNWAAAPDGTTAFVLFGEGDMPGTPAPTAATIADAVWDEAQADHVAAGTFGIVASEVADILVDTAVIGALGAGLTAIPWNAAWDAEVQSEVFDALDAAFTDATGLTANGLLDRIRTLGWILRNKIDVTNLTGNTKIYKDDSVTEGFSVNGMLTDDSTNTVRLRAA